MSRTARATIAAAFGYLQFGAALIAGLWLVPFTLRHIETRRYGLWLASGEWLAYAGLAELGVLVTLPWLIAEADGRGDRVRMRHLVSTGAAAGVLTTAVYGVVALALWLFLPSLMHLQVSDRGAVLGPLLVVAIAGCVVQPLRIFGAVLNGLQDVRFNGLASLTNWSLGFTVTVLLLPRGFGLYALALAAVLPSLAGGIWNLARVLTIAPDLLRDLPRPRWDDIRRLYVEGMGTWIGGWGWRMIAASDGLVLAALGRPAQVAALACTNKLAQSLVQFSWIPCDNGLVGLAQLAGEQQEKRLKDAVVVMVRVYLALAGAVACVVLAANPSFVRRWVGPELFAGSIANTLIAILAIAMTFGHAVAVIPSVLGQRLQIGMASLGCGLLHVGLAVTLGFRFGVTGVLAAGVVSHGIVFGLLAWRPFTRATRMSEAALLGDVVRPWLVRAAPMIALAVLIDWFVATPPLLVTVAAGGSLAALVMWHMRPLYLEFGPVRTMYDRVMRWPPRQSREVQPS
jgi:O-antigen/teichoic acid export membrane protein